MLQRVERGKSRQCRNYFADYDTTVHFISEEELKANHSGNPARRICTQSGVTGWEKEKQTSDRIQSETGFQSGIYFFCNSGICKSSISPA